MFNELGFGGFVAKMGVGFQNCSNSFLVHIPLLSKLKLGHNRYSGLGVSYAITLCDEDEFLSHINN